MNEITIGDKIYISAKRAAEITGYARDYVGQLCREGHVDAKMVGRSWYVFEPSIRAHRFGTDAVTSAVSADAAPDEPVEATEAPGTVTEQASEVSEGASMAAATPKYTAESPEMLPELTPARLEELLPPPEETLTDMQSAWREWFEQKQKALETPEIESPEVIDERNEAYEDEYEPTEDDESVSDDESEEYVDEEVAIPMHRIQDEPEIAAPGPIADEEEVAIRHIAHPPMPTYDPVPAAHMDISRQEERYVAEEAPFARYEAQYAAPQAPQGRILQERVVTKKGKRVRKAKSAGSGSNAPIIAVLVGISFIAVAIAVIGTGYASRYLRTLPAENNPVINFLVGTEKISR